MKLLSCVRFFATPWTVAYQAPPSMEFSRLEYWSGLPFPSPGYLPDPGIEPRSLTLQADALPSELPGKPQINLGSDQLHLWYSMSQSIIMHVCIYGSLKDRISSLPSSTGTNTSMLSYETQDSFSFGGPRVWHVYR